jgi:hypothetical protein
MKGEVVYLYAFDVANEIVTARVQQILSEKPFPFEIRMDHTLPKDMPLCKPLAIEPRRATELNGAPVRLLVRVYDVGVVTVLMRVAFEVSSLRELMPFHDAQLDDGRLLDTAAHQLCSEVCQNLKPFMISASGPLPTPEAYTVFCFTDLDGAADATAWLAEHRREVAGLLTQTEPSKLSEMQIAEVTRIQRSFENSDLAVIDWDAALVVGLEGYVDDTLYALELANLQLEEFRVMDKRLDGYLDRAYDEFGRSRPPLFGSLSLTLRNLRRFRVDVTKLTDEVTNITKFFGDWHLARVYLGARERFYIDHWSASVERRLKQLDELYNVAQSELTNRRMVWLEAIIVLFFAIDIILILFWK